jgi:5'-nucleotidase
MKKDGTLESPFTVAIIDTFDADPVADIFDEERYAIVGKNYTYATRCTSLASRLFKALNPGVKNIDDWVDGHDVRVYDSAGHCFCKAHEMLEKTNRPQKRLYIDMDNVIVDFKSGIEKLDERTKKEYEFDLDDVPGIFALMEPMPGAIDAFVALSRKFDIYILSTAPWANSSAWSDKIEWVKKYLGKSAFKRLILTHHKNLNKGDYLVDDRTKNGVDKFSGEHIHFGTKDYPDWESVKEYLLLNQV